MARQTVLPGTDGDRIKEIDEAAAEYREARDIRMQCLVSEIEAKARLLERMRENGLEVYRLADADPPEEVAIVAGEETVKVRKVKGEGAPARVENGGDGDTATDEEGQSVQ